MKTILVIIFAVFALTTMALGADNTLGTWKYNAGKSKAAPGLPQVLNLTITREAAGDGVKVSVKGERADGAKIDFSYTAKYDGKEVTIAGISQTWDTTAIKQVDANTIAEERSKKGGKYRGTYLTVISADGKAMTATSKGTGADGKPFTAEAVFDKQ